MDHLNYIEKLFDQWGKKMLMTDLIKQLEEAIKPNRELNEIIGQVVFGYERCTINGCGGVHNAGDYTHTLHRCRADACPRRS